MFTFLRNMEDVLLFTLSLSLLYSDTIHDLGLDYEEKSAKLKMYHFPHHLVCMKI